MTVLQRRLVVCGALVLPAIGLLAAQTETVYVTRTEAEVSPRWL